MKGIYSFQWDCGRYGNVYGLFLADSEDVSNAIGKRIYFGEILGKHSEVQGSLEATEVTLKSDAPECVEIFERLNLTTGYNPLSYLYEEEEEEQE